MLSFMRNKSTIVGLLTASLFVLAVGYYMLQRPVPLKTEQSSDQLSYQLELKVPLLMKRDAISGAGLVLLRRGKVIFTQYYGEKTGEKSTPIDEQTVFEAASLGKPVFAYLVMRLAEEGALDLNRPLAEQAAHLIAELNLAYNDRMSLITPAMLLSHRSGLPNYTQELPVTLTFEPGTAFQYSGLGYDLLQKLVEKRSGQSLEELAQQYIFAPFGMTNTSYVWRPWMKDRLAGGITRQPIQAHAAWSLYTTPSDYGRFLQYFLAESRTGQASSTMMLKPQIQLTDKIAWGLGWGLQLTTPSPSFWHWGSNPGARSYVVGYPMEGLAIAVFSNGETLFKAVDEIILEAIGGELPSYDWF